MSDYTPMYPDELERAEKAPRLKSYDDLEDENAALKQQLAEQNALYDKAFSESGGLLHRRELVRMLDERDAQLDELREAAREVVAWDWAELKYSPYHVDWFEALVDVGLLEKLLQESEDVV